MRITLIIDNKPLREYPKNVFSNFDAVIIIVLPLQLDIRVKHFHM